jgi:type IV secretory pathway component VirB8
MTTDDEYRQYLDILGEDVVRHRLANRMPIGDKAENNPPYELARTWLTEKAKARNKVENRRFWIILIIAIISAVAAGIAAIPVVQSWIK